MNELNPNECRVLGTLVEKAQTVQSQYPLTLNALISGCNQKNNRDPVMNLNEDQVMDALDGLRAKGLAREVMMSGSRVSKYRHVAREALDVSTTELVILAELLLRGPQTIGEIRGRASRMHPLESMDIVAGVLDHLMQRETPLVKKVPPAPGSRSERYIQLLCPDLHQLNVASPTSTHPSTASAVSTATGAISPDVDRRLSELESRINALTNAVRRLADSLGEGDPFRGID